MTSWIDVDAQRLNKYNRCCSMMTSWEAWGLRHTECVFRMSHISRRPTNFQDRIQFHFKCLFVFSTWYKLWLIYHFSQFQITMDITQCTLFCSDHTLKVGFPPVLWFHHSMLNFRSKCSWCGLTKLIKNFICKTLMCYEQLNVRVLSWPYVVHILSISSQSLFIEVFLFAFLIHFNEASKQA